MPKNRKIAKQIKIEKNQVENNFKITNILEKRTRGNCDNLLFNAWKKYKGKALFFKLF